MAVSGEFLDAGKLGYELRQRGSANMPLRIMVLQVPQ
jgi:hypothetical protein